MQYYLLALGLATITAAILELWYFGVRWPHWLSDLFGASFVAPASVSPTADKVDVVFTSVYSQKVISPGDRIPVQLFLHNDLEDPDPVAKRIDPGSESRGTSLLLENLARDTIVEAELQCLDRSLVVETGPKPIRWMPDLVREAFFVSAGPDATLGRTVPMRFIIKIGLRSIGGVDFSLHIGSKLEQKRGAEVLESEGAAVRKDFHCFAPEDFPRITAVEPSLARTLQEILRTRRRKPAAEVIAQCDVFSFYWSRAAKSSSLVRSQYNAFDARESACLINNIRAPLFSSFELENPSPRPWPELETRPFARVRDEPHADPDGSNSSSAPPSPLGNSSEGLTGIFHRRDGRRFVCVPIGPASTRCFFQIRGIFQDVLKGSEKQGPKMVVLPQGRFLMGSPPNEVGRHSSEERSHEVAIGEPFALARFAVTIEDWDNALSNGLERYLEAEANPVPADYGRGRSRQPEQHGVGDRGQGGRISAGRSGRRLGDLSRIGTGLCSRVSIECSHCSAGRRTRWWHLPAGAVDPGEEPVRGTGL